MSDLDKLQEITETDFREALKDPEIQKVWQEIERYNQWLSMQPTWLQEEIDKKCREKLKELNP